MEYESEEKVKKSKTILIRKLIFVGILSLICTMLLYFKFKLWDILEIMELSFGAEWLFIGVLLTYITIFGFLFGLFSLGGKNKKEKEEQLLPQEKEIRREEDRKEDQINKKRMVNLMVSLMATASLVYSEVISIGGMGIPWLSVILCFGICYLLCEAFSYVPAWTLKNIALYGVNFVMKVAIPSMFIIIILLGAINGTYYPESTFTTNVAEAMSGAMDIMSDAIYNGFYSTMFLTLYNLGFDKPELWIYLSVAAILILILNSFIQVFKKPEESDETKSMEEIIKEVSIEEEIKRLKEEGKKEKTAGDRFGEWFEGVFNTEKDKEKKKMEEEEEKRNLEIAKANRDRFIIKEMKGGIIK